MVISTVFSIAGTRSSRCTRWMAWSINVLTSAVLAVRSRLFIRPVNWVVSSLLVIRQYNPGLNAFVGRDERVQMFVTEPLERLFDRLTSAVVTLPQPLLVDEYGNGRRQHELACASIVLGDTIASEVRKELVGNFLFSFKHEPARLLVNFCKAVEDDRLFIGHFFQMKMREAPPFPAGPQSQ